MELCLASLAFSDFAKEFKRKNAGFMAIAEIDLIGVISDRKHARRADWPDFFGIENVEGGRRLGFGSIFPAGGAGASVAQRSPRDFMADAVAPTRQERLAVSFEGNKRWIFVGLGHEMQYNATAGQTEVCLDRRQASQPDLQGFTLPAGPIMQLIFCFLQLFSEKVD